MAGGKPWSPIIQNVELLLQIHAKCSEGSGLHTMAQAASYIWFSTLPLRQKALSLIKHLVFICVRPTFAVVTEKRFVPKNARV